MTWDEFKELVDKKLKAEGRDGSTRVGYIKFAGNYQTFLEEKPDFFLSNKGRGPEEAFQLWNA